MPRLTPAEVRLPELSRIAGVPEEDRETRGCGRFEQGCTCSACQDEYFRSYANRRTYGGAPEAPSAADVDERIDRILGEEG
jgi:hypothetical protein